MSALVSTVTTEDFKRLKKQRCKWHLFAFYKCITEKHEKHEY